MKAPIPYFHKGYEDLKNLIEHFLPDYSESSQRKYEELFDNAQFNVLLASAPSIVIVLNVQTVKYEYFSKNVKNILGYDSERYMKEGLGFAMSTMDPDHLFIHNKYLYAEILKHTARLAGKKELKDLRFTTTFKVRKMDGNYLWAMQQFSIIETDRDGMPWLSLIFMHDVSDVKKDNCLDLVIAQKNKDGLFTPIFAGVYPTVGMQTIFTKRELEVLSFICKGFSSKMIAAALNLSEHTVNTHRKNMMKKTESKNSAELSRCSLAEKIFPADK